MFIVGLLGFAIASAVGGAAPNIGTLVTARAVQGGFAAILAPAALSLITVIFTHRRELNKAFGIFGAVSGSAGAIGLLLGGLLAENRSAAYLTLFLANAAVFAVFLFLTYYFQGVLRYSPITTGVAFLSLMVTIGVVATLTQGVLLQRLTMRFIVAAGLIASGAGAALLTQADAGSPYAAWVLPGLVLIGTGIGSAAVVAVAVGQMGVELRDAGTAGALNNVSQQLGSALGVALISTFVATATNHYLTEHGSTAVAGATVHGFAIGSWWAAGLFWAAAVSCGALIRGGTRLHHEAGQPEPLDGIVSALI
jgi:hypothetical protein